MDIQTATIVITGIGVLIAAVSQIYTNRQANQQRAIELKNQELTLHAQHQALETRQAELFMQLYNRWSSPELVNAYIVSRYQIQDDELKQLIDHFLTAPLRDERSIEIFKHQQVMNLFFEGLGMLVKKQLIDINIVEDLLKQRFIWFFERMTPFIIQTRQGLRDPTMFSNMEYLYHELKQREQATRAPQ